MDYVILFFDGSKIIVSKDLIEQIRKSPPSITKFKIGESDYTRSSMAKILSLEDFFSQYPEERPEERNEWEFKEAKPLTAEEYKRMHTGMLSGIKKFIDENKKKGIEVNKAEKMYERCKNSQIDKNAVLQSM